MADQTRDALTAAEQAAMDAWMRGSADTTGMLYAVRAAVAQMDRSEDARLAIAEKHLRDANEMLCGTVENGPWVLITDPELHQIVREYVADACHSVASVAGLDEAMERAHDATPQRLARTLPGQRVTPEARERLARHLWIADAGDPDTWDRLLEAGAQLAEYNQQTGSTLRLDGAAEREKLLAAADRILAVITGQENSR